MVFELPCRDECQDRFEQGLRWAERWEGGRFAEENILEPIKWLVTALTNNIERERFYKEINRTLKTTSRECNDRPAKSCPIPPTRYTGSLYE